MSLRWCEGPCGRELPATLDYFHTTGGSYLTRTCKRCRRVRQQERLRLPTVRLHRRQGQRRYRQANREKLRAYRLAWNLAHPDSNKLYRRRYRLKHGKAAA